MRIKPSLKSDFLAGLVLVAPLLATLVILQFVFSWVTGFLAPLVEGSRLATLTANNVLLAQLLALVLFVAVVTAVGAVAQWSVGKRLFGRTGRVVTFIPVFRTIYGSIRGMVSSVTTRSSDFESVVYVEWPQDGVYRLGLKTGESPADMAEVAGETAYNVFVPGSPNPTQGSLVLVPESQAYESELSVRAAIRLLMTTGMAESEEESVIQLSDAELDEAVSTP
ncbi:DUF502 domain-containing protein [Salarchaeum sp. JOR-1]|uniref:DUF502 domain-containing protein n=1 Tax=Salarchaeum sp. JOR-1 TaxID=2599399 RepID=UPI00119853F5|nr:DUF502 domain-containing protein [Salarchaeum sp. JOR-1]QDX41344.1 DUF502 domain-containing protein [Salarchaeum sp. JOR-1]